MKARRAILALRMNEYDAMFSLTATRLVASTWLLLIRLLHDRLRRVGSAVGIGWGSAAAVILATATAA